MGARADHGNDDTVLFIQGAGRRSRRTKQRDEGMLSERGSDRRVTMTRTTSRSQHLAIESLFDICFSLWLRIWGQNNSVIIQPFMYLAETLCVCEGREDEASESARRGVRGRDVRGIRELAASPIPDPGGVAIATVLALIP